MEWTREKTLSLINEYRKRRGLWDMTHDDYRKKEIKQKLLIEVSASLGGGIPIVEIEKKFHTLRTQYHREINRMKRKEPYNSKWFGFKNLQFLSSPKACRSNKGRIKSEITEDGTVMTKYIVRESSQQDSCGGGGSSSNLNDEFLTIHRKAPITYEAVVSTGGGNNQTSTTNRAHELEKLIEETTKDVEDIDDAKPKIITVPIDNHTYSAQIHTGSASDLSGGEQDPLQQNVGNHHHTHEDQNMEEDEEPIETIDIQPVDEDGAYQSSSSIAGGGVHTQTNTQHHHHGMPARIIKIQRRNTCQEEDYYDDNQQQAAHQVHAVPATTTKRIYYDSNGHQHTATIMATSTPGVTTQPISNSTLLNAMPKFQPHQQQQHNRSLQHQQANMAATLQRHDEYATYGEYVANEMRGIMNREVLIALKHKINTALFEASMAELQK